MSTSAAKVCESKTASFIELVKFISKPSIYGELNWFSRSDTCSRHFKFLIYKWKMSLFRDGNDSRGIRNSVGRPIKFMVKRMSNLSSHGHFSLFALVDV